ncbi:MAG: hypothetical protein IT292_12125 [Deltaproteobacteria bacterium]|nr:hypothetical protein [Deltaproteobacteria bacterium]
MATADFADALCQNLESKDPGEEITAPERQDFLQELCNVISGNFLTETYGNDTVFDLVYSALKPVNQELVTRILNNKLTLTFSADDHMVAIAVEPSNFI